MKRTNLFHLSGKLNSLAFSSLLLLFFTLPSFYLTAQVTSTPTILSSGFTTEGEYVVCYRIDLVNNGTTDLCSPQISSDLITAPGYTGILRLEAISLSQSGFTNADLNTTATAFNTGNPEGDAVDPATIKCIPPGGRLRLAYKVYSDPAVVGDGTTVTVNHTTSGIDDAGAGVAQSDAATSSVVLTSTNVIPGAAMQAFQGGSALANAAILDVNLDGTYDFTYRVTLGNYQNDASTGINATNITFTDNFGHIHNIMPINSVSVVASPAGNLTPNPNFNGGASTIGGVSVTPDIQIVSGGTLTPDQTDYVDVILNVGPTTNTSNRFTSGIVQADQNVLGGRVSEISIFGQDPENGDPRGPADACGGGTTVRFGFAGQTITTKTLISSFKAASGVPGHYDLTYEVVIQADPTNDINLKRMSAIDDIESTFGSAFVQIVGTPIVTNIDATSVPLANGTYDGETGTGVGSDVDLLAGSQTDIVSPGESFRITYTAEVNLIGAVSPLNNTVEVSGANTSNQQVNVVSSNAGFVFSDPDGDGLLAQDDLDDDNDGIPDAIECSEPNDVGNTGAGTVGSGIFVDQLAFVEWGGDFNDGVDVGDELTQTLSDGSQITITVTAANAGSKSFVPNGIDTFGGALLQTQYDDNGNNYALYSNIAGPELEVTFQVSAVTSIGNVFLPSIIFTDGERTDSGETNSATTDGTPWIVVEEVAYTGAGASISGLGTTAVTLNDTEFGVPLLRSNGVTELTFRTTDIPAGPTGRQALTFGFLTQADDDLDGIANCFDRDSDNDGIPDTVEAGATDVDRDGVVDGFTDADNDGLNDAQDNIDNGGGGSEVSDGTPLPLTNTDGNGNPDYLDIDADDDGIPDNIEAQPTATYNPPLNADDDGDGIDNQYDPDFVGSTPFITIENTDGTDNPDYRDLDSDNDTLTDVVEGGRGTLTDPNADTDGDGLNDAFEGANLNDPADVNDEINDPTTLPDTQIPGGDVDYRDSPDADGDGVPDIIDLDDDNDGIPDTAEGTGDSDGDGIIDALDLDSDNDGIPDIVEAGGTDTDGDGQVDYPTPGDPTSMVDADGDGLDDSVDNIDNGSGAGEVTDGTPLADEDSDGDGVADRLDLDSDNDGITDIVEAGGTDANGDGEVDYATPGDPTTMVDVDGDGFIDTIDTDDNTVAGTGDGGTALPDEDTDGDGTEDRLDLDSDNDGIYDVVESGGDDVNADGRADDDDDNADNTASNGIPTSAGTGNDPTETTPGTPDHLNLDSDGDGCSDANEAYVDPNGDGGDGGQYGTGTPAPTGADGLVSAAPYDTGTVAAVTDAGDATACEDADGDGIPDVTDLDDDNDGIPDTAEGTGDSDGDGIIDALDLDSDNDGIPDIVEAGGTDTDGDGQVDYPTPGDPTSMVDADGDGLDDSVDNIDNGSGAGEVTDGTPLADEDSDGDGVADRLDLDSDNDGITDIVEAGGTDANGDGEVDYATPGDPTTMVDVDGDGFIDTIDTDDNTVAGTGDGGTALPDEDTDGDGTEDRLDLDSDNDGIYDVVESGGDDVNADGRADDDDDNADNTASNGIPTSAGTGNDPTETTPGTPDHLNLDSDGDGCSDANEAYVDPNGDGGDGGQFGTGTPAPTGADGLVSAAPYDTGAVAAVTDAGDATACEDADGDGIPDVTDLDDDNDGIPDTAEGTGDSDGDGIIDALDLDSDNDGIPDIIEAGGTDTDGDGQVDYPTPGDPTSMNDTNNDGLDDGIAADPLADEDSDGDGVVDRLDLDSDNDGITDIVEAGGTDTNGDGEVDYATPGDPTTMVDVDGDGFIDTIDTDDNTVAGTGDGGTALPDEDTDGDGTEDRLDLDSDNDGIYDVVESGGDDVNADGRADDDDDNADNTASNGIPTSAGTGNDPTETTPGTPDHLNLDSDGDGCSDANEAYVDPNGDGGDGGQFGTGTPAPTGADGLVSAAPYDTGTVAAVTDAGDATACEDADGDGIPDVTDLDDDNDGIPDTAEGTGDSDGDGIIDALDLDSDNDGIPDIVEAGGTDTDGDGQVDYPTPGDPTSMNDTNNDGLDDGIAADPLADEDSDGDGVVDRLDLDSDNDGITDIVEAGGTDANGDGEVDYATPGDPTTMVDVDGDGFIDTIDTDDNTVAGTGDGGTALPDEDTDGDGTEDRLDLDSDNDGIYDVVESGGDDVNADGRADDDDDNADNTASNGIPTSAGTGNDPTETTPGTPDHLNLDSDGDGCSDANEAYVDPNGDGGDGGQFGTGTPAPTGADGLVSAAPYDTGTVAAVTDATDSATCIVDSDGDGVLDEQEIADGTDPNDPCDFVIANITEMQTGDYLDADCDGDGVTNQQEVADGTNPEDPCDFTIDSITLVQTGDYLITDCDGDGVTNGTEITDGTDPNDPCDFNVASVSLDPSGDYLIADCDGDTISNGQEIIDGTDPNDPCSSRGGTPPAGSVCDITIDNDLVGPQIDEGFFRINNIDAFPNNTVRIYNRWGILVFETNGYDSGSNNFRGISNGRATIQQNEALPVGVYFYVIDYINNGVSQTKSGYLYVNR